MEAIEKINNEIRDNEIENNLIKLAKHISGEKYYSFIQEAIDAETEWRLEQFFYCENLNLFEGHYLTIELLNNYSPAVENVRIELNEDFNLLLDYITDLDSTYYFSDIILYNELSREQILDNRQTAETEELGLLLWDFTEEHITNITEKHSAQDIKEWIHLQDYYYDSNTFNIELLSEKIADAWQALTEDLEHIIDECMGKKYAELYYNAETEAIEYFRQNPDTL